MQRQDFLYEIGVEEIPAGFIDKAMKKLESWFKEQLKQHKLSYEAMHLYSTPRRFAILIEQLQTMQEDEVMERIGPAERIAYDADGNLSKAGQGFLRGAGATEDDVYIKETDKGRYIGIRIEKKGQPAKDILKEICTGILREFNFPKSMRWNTREFTFARPVRWLLALLGEEIIPIRETGLKSDRYTWGNRWQKLENRIEIASPSEYLQKLEAVKVIPQRERREQMIREQLANLEKSDNLHVIMDERLIEICTDLVESPTAVAAEFDERFLRLPEKIITSTLSEHQKCFAAEDKDGKLVNKFIFISNGDPNYSDLIKLGNEKVIRPRLNDAEFYYDEDTAQPLESFVPRLEDVTFQAKLGTLLEKTGRIRNLCEFISKQVSLDAETATNADRAALLCKTDLVTTMLGEKEFTKLQGYIGGKYALQCGEPQDVATAIEEHYLPRGQNDGLPTTIPGALVAISDKLDTVCGIIGVDMIPTGSNDPFALRRAANGIVLIIDQFGFELSILDLIDHSFQLLEEKLEEKDHNKKIVRDFFKQRVDWLLQQKNIDYDVIASVMHIDYSNIPDLVHRAQALQAFKTRDDFTRLVLGFKRVSNIIEEAGELKPVNPELLQEAAEKALYEGYVALEKRIVELLPKKDYTTCLDLLVEYGAAIDRFFDDVLVNTEDIPIRKNRYSLLSGIRKLFLRIADIAKIVVEGDQS